MFWWHGSDERTKGGPGDSGVEFGVQIAAVLQRVIGTEYDIVAFDPR